MQKSLITPKASLARLATRAPQGNTFSVAACDVHCKTRRLQNKFCHSIFVLSLTRFAFRNPNGITYGYATFDLLLQNSPMTKQVLSFKIE